VQLGVAERSERCGEEPPARAEILDHEQDVIDDATANGHDADDTGPRTHAAKLPRSLTSTLAIDLVEARYRGTPVGRKLSGPFPRLTDLGPMCSGGRATDTESHNAVRGGDRFASTILEVPRPALHGRDARDVPVGRWGQMEEQLMASGTEGRSMRLRRLVYSAATLVALVVAISAGWKN
jgi:hypothetical protein